MEINMAVVDTTTEVVTTEAVVTMAVVTMEVVDTVVIGHLKQKKLRLRIERPKL